MSKVKIYNANQYTKTGKLKKNAETERSYDNCTVQYIAQSLKEWGYHSFTSPYLFNHIDAINSKGEAVFIFISVDINGREITASPTALFAKLIYSK